MIRELLDRLFPFYSENTRLREELTKAQALIEHQVDLLKKFKAVADAAMELHDASQELMKENISLKALLGGQGSTTEGSGVN